MNDQEFIKLAIKFLKYSFEDINYDYDSLSLEEKELTTKAEFDSLILYLKSYEET